MRKSYPALFWIGRIVGGIIVGGGTYLWLWTHPQWINDQWFVVVSLAFGALTVVFGGRFFEMIVGSDDLY